MCCVHVRVCVYMCCVHVHVRVYVYVLSACACASVYVYVCVREVFHPSSQNTRQAHYILHDKGITNREGETVPYFKFSIIHCVSSISKNRYYC